MSIGERAVFFVVGLFVCTLGTESAITYYERGNRLGVACAVVAVAIGLVCWSCAFSFFETGEEE